MELLRTIAPYVAALLPSAGLLYLFYVVMKHILEGDRRERAAQRRWEEEHASSTDRQEPTDPGGS